MRLLKFLLFSFVLLSLLFGQLLTLVAFRLNENYIAANLCENKARPLMHCNGKCKLGKKLAEENGDRKHLLSFAKADVLCLPGATYVTARDYNVTAPLVYALYGDALYNTGVIHKMLRPPQQEKFLFA